MSPAILRRSTCRAPNRSGLRAAVDILDGIDDIHIAELTSADVVRHRLVSEIVDAYAQHEEPGSDDEPGGATGIERTQPSVTAS